MKAHEGTTTLSSPFVKTSAQQLSTAFTIQYSILHCPTPPKQH
jgi:hypothetical protein